MGFFSCCALQAQSGFFGAWFQHSNQAKADRASCMTLLVTVAPRLKQEYRAVFLVEEMTAGNDLINDDGAKGLDLISWERIELLFNMPPCIEHHNPGDGRPGTSMNSEMSFFQMFSLGLGPGPGSSH